MIDVHASFVVVIAQVIIAAVAAHTIAIAITIAAAWVYQKSCYRHIRHLAAVQQ